MFGDERGFFFESCNRARFQRATGHPTPASCRTTTRARRAASCAACTTRCASRRASWCAWSPARSSTSRSTCAAARRPSARGSARIVRREPQRAALDPAGLRARLPGRLARSRDVLYKAPTTTRRSTSARSPGTIPSSRIAWPLAATPMLSATRTRRGARLRDAEAASLRILLTGEPGQVGWELARRLAALGERAALGPARRSTSRTRTRCARVVATARPDVIVNAAAYTAVDHAESGAGARAARSTATAPGVLARGGDARSARCSSTTRPTTCSTATKAGAYVETTRPIPLSVYGRTKLAGERRDRGERLRPPDPAHELGLRPARPQLPAHHPAARRRARRAARGRRPARRADWARDLAEATAHGDDRGADSTTSAPRGDELARLRDRDHAARRLDARRPPDSHGRIPDRRAPARRARCSTMPACGPWPGSSCRLGK